MHGVSHGTRSTYFVLTKLGILSYLIYLTSLGMRSLVPSLSYLIGNVLNQKFLISSLKSFEVS